MTTPQWWEKADRFFGKEKIYDDGVFSIYKYGSLCAKRLSYFVGDSKTKRILKLSFSCIEDAKKWIQGKQINLSFNIEE